MGGSRVGIAAVFVSLESHDVLAAAMAAQPDVTVGIGYRHVPEIDPGTVLIWVLGCVTAGIAAFRSAAHNRWVP